MPNPLAIGVTLGGLLLDVVVPRPKPRAGFAYQSREPSAIAVSRTPRRHQPHEQSQGAPVVSG